MRYQTISLLMLVLMIGCSHSLNGPTLPDPNPGTMAFTASSAPQLDNHILWGQWMWYMPETHDRIDIMPVRSSDAHMNVLKLLEFDCADCLEIVGIQNNGDSTLDVTVRIKHPHPTESQYTGFDVKGILIFNGSYEMPSNYYMPQYPEPMRISWREMGDAEVLNADGYTTRWHVNYDSGSTLPLLNYWKGKYASTAEPDGNLNAYLNFYTHEERHMFVASGAVERTYHIYVPPGPLTAAYSVEANWVPPDVMPVVNPLEDFPISANMVEPYLYKIVINNYEPFIDYCCGWDYDCSDLYYEIKQWNGVTVHNETRHHSQDDGAGIGSELFQCDTDPDHYRGLPYGFTLTEPGPHRGYGIIKHATGNPDAYWDQLAFTVFDWKVEK